MIDHVVLKLHGGDIGNERSLNVLRPFFHAEIKYFFFVAVIKLKTAAKSVLVKILCCVKMGYNYPPFSFIEILAITCFLNI